MLNGAEGFVAFVPLNNANGHFDGYMTGVYRIDKLFDRFFSNNKIKYAVQIKDGNHVIYQALDAKGRKSGKSGSKPFAIQDGFDMQGLHWDIVLSLPDSEYRQLESFIPQSSVLLGLLLTLLSSITVYFGRKSKQQKQESLESLQKFEAIFNQSFQFIGLMNPDGILIAANETGLQAGGVKESDVIGKPFWETVWWSHSTELQEKLKKAIADGRDGKFSRFEVQHPLPSGDMLDVDFSLKPVQDKDGHVILLIPEGRDITDIKKAEKKLSIANYTLQMIRHALDQSTIVAITDPRGVITYVNDAFCHISQYSREELVGKTHQILNSGYHNKGFFKSMWKTISSGSTWYGEVKNKAKDGSEYWVDTTITPFLDTDGKIESYIAIRHDITDTKNLEQSLVDAKSLAEQASKFKSEFLANMSHEIRTPMNGILGMTEITLGTELSPEQRQYLNMVYSSGTNLLTIINDILDFSKIEAGKLELDPVPFKLRELVSETMHMFNGQVREKGIELIYHIDPELPNSSVADPTRLRQILTNLLSNSIKFTSEGEVFVSVELEESLEGEKINLKFTVKDSGIGMSEKQMEKVFDPFTQADGSITRKFGGTGLGLSISTQLIRMMNGNVSVQSELGKGTLFTFTVETQCSHEAEEAPSVLLDIEALKNVRVLIVDDNQTNLHVVDKMVTRWGMDTTLVGNPSDVISLMEQAYQAKKPYELILSDYGMPEIDGFTLAEFIKKRTEFKNTKIIILSSYNQSGDMAKCREIGLNGYLPKPVGQPELLSLIRSVMADLANSSSTTLNASLKTKPLIREKGAPVKILLAEDNEVNQMVARHILEEAGHLVSIANNGLEAVREWHTNEYDLILMDVMMPEMDGLEATKMIRREELSMNGSHIPIVALTANAIKGDREKCLDSGMDDYVSKPFSRSELLSAVDALCSMESETETFLNEAEAANPEEKMALFNKDELLDRMGGDKEFLNKIVRTFEGSYKEKLEKLEQAIQEHDSVSLHELAHSLKGQVGNFSQNKPFQILQEIETAGKTEDFDNSYELLGTLKEEIKDLVGQLIEFVEV